MFHYFFWDLLNNLNLFLYRMSCISWVRKIFTFYINDLLLFKRPFPGSKGYLQQLFSIHFKIRTCFNAKYKNKWNKNHQFKKQNRLWFPYSGNAVSLKHYKRDASYKTLRSGIYRIPLFNGCTLHQIRFSIFFFVRMGYSGKFQGS